MWAAVGEVPPPQQGRGGQGRDCMLATDVTLLVFAMTIRHRLPEVGRGFPVRSAGSAVNAELLRDEEVFLVSVPLTMLP